MAVCAINCKANIVAKHYPRRRRPVTKALPITGMILSGLCGVLFLADLAAGIPFSRVSIPMDIGVLISCGILAYLSLCIYERR